MCELGDLETVGSKWTKQHSPSNCGTSNLRHGDVRNKPNKSSRKKGTMRNGKASLSGGVISVMSIKFADMTDER